MRLPTSTCYRCQLSYSLKGIITTEPFKKWFEGGKFSTASCGFGSESRGSGQWWWRLCCTRFGAWSDTERGGLESGEGEGLWTRWGHFLSKRNEKTYASELYNCESLNIYDAFLTLTCCHILYCSVKKGPKSLNTKQSSRKSKSEL